MNSFHIKNLVIDGYVLDEGKTLIPISMVKIWKLENAKLNRVRANNLGNSLGATFIDFSNLEVEQLIIEGLEVTNSDVTVL